MAPVFAVLALLSLTLVAGCAVGPANPPGLRATTQAATQTPTKTPYPTSSATLSIDPDRWTTEDRAKSSLAAFLADAKSASSYRVFHAERAGLDGGYVDVIGSYVVDRAAGLVHATMTFEASSADVEQQMLSGGDAASLDDLAGEIVVDYTGDTPRVLVRYGVLGRQWIDVSTAKDFIERLGLDDFLTSSPDDLVAPAVDVAALQPAGFMASRYRLVYQVPGDKALSWMPSSLLKSVADAGVDLSSYDLAPSAGYVYGVEGGIAIIVNVSETMNSVRPLADLLQGETETIYLTWYDLNTTEKVSLPDPSTITTDIPTS